MQSAKRKPWTREELILAINLYCKTPFGKIHIRNPEIIKLAEYLDRTPGSISYKLANFASIDPSLSRKGASNVSKLDREVWQEFFNDWESMVYESEKKMTKLYRDGQELDFQLKEGLSKERTVKTRVNQQFFRKMVLSSYNGKCCITGIPIEGLLVASHIVPWSIDKKNRLNPCNGICLNALHDRAFDKGLISISNDYELIVSSKIKEYKAEEVELISKYKGRRISLPRRFLPNKGFLDYHRKKIFCA